MSEESLKHAGLIPSKNNAHGRQTMKNAQSGLWRRSQLSRQSVVIIVKPGRPHVLPVPHAAIYRGGCFNHGVRSAQNIWSAKATAGCLAKNDRTSRRIGKRMSA